MSSSNGNSPSIVVIEPAANLESVGDRLTAQQHAVLSLLAFGQSVIAAAESAGIHRGTIHRWLSSDPNFRAAYNAWKKETVELAAGRLAKLSDNAVSVVCEALQSREARTAVAVLKGLGLLCGRRPAGATHPPDVHRIAQLRDGHRQVRLHDRQRELEREQHQIDWLRYCQERDERRRREQPADGDGDGDLSDEQPNPDLTALDEEIERRRLPPRGPRLRRARSLRFH